MPESAPPSPGASLPAQRPNACVTCLTSSPREDLVVLLDAQPMGLLQRSRISDYPEEVERFSTLVDIPPGAIELDYLIADPARRGRGLGTRLIEAAVARTWINHPCAPAVLVAVVAA